MSKYAKLTQLLTTKNDEFITLEFRQIEKALGFLLPASAYKYREWWANSENSQQGAWKKANYAVQSIDMAAEKVTFQKISSGDTSINKISPLTIPEAKAGLAKSLGVSESNIEIIIRS